MRFLFTMSDFFQDDEAKLQTRISHPASKPLIASLIEDQSNPPNLAALADQNDLQTDISSGAHPMTSALHSDILVEPDGIEPTTSCLQSTRSPN
jgi:hypothetical protein